MSASLDIQMRADPQPRDGAFVEPSDGKEGVNGSSPLEGFRKFLLISSFRCRQRRRERPSASTERPRAGESVSDEAANRRC